MVGTASSGFSGFRLHRLDLGDQVIAFEATVDVVFVHGLTGDPIATWSIAGDSAAGYTGWPIDLVREFQGKARLWVAGYSAPLIASSSEQQSLLQQGREALCALTQASLGDRKVLFVAHSVGGILVKAILSAASASQDAREKQVLRNTHGVIFVGTPHAGSDLTLLRHAVPIVARTVASGFGWLLTSLLGATLLATTAFSLSIFGLHWTASIGGLIAGGLLPLIGLIVVTLVRPSEHVLNLDPDNPALFDLTHDYRRVLAIRPFATRAFYERQRLWFLFRPVPRTSADPGVTDCMPVGLSANHISMCKGVNAAPIAAELRELIRATRRGLDQPVFERYLNPDEFELALRSKIEILLRMPDGSYVRRFADVKGDRREGERYLREHLRHKFGNAEPPTVVEIELAEVSTFDLDNFIWCMWHERITVRSQRKLRLNAAAAMERWQKEFQDVRPSLIAFYRPMRTIEHNLLGDLAERSLQSERVTLMEMLREARRILDARCPEVTGKIGARVWGLDGDAGTRRMLLRMQSALEAGDASYQFFDQCASSHHEDAARHRLDLDLWGSQFRAALQVFKAALISSKLTDGGGTGVVSQVAPGVSKRVGE
jgi:hypothetical protein